MMKEEFEKRIGLVITPEEYEVIEAAYMGMPESVDKDKFVKIWLKEGGIQDLFDKRLLRAKALAGYVKDLERKNSEQAAWIEKVEKDCAEYVREIMTLKEKLVDISAWATEAASYIALTRPGGTGPKRPLSYRILPGGVGES
jgi:hypothetical protein